MKNNNVKKIAGRTKLFSAIGMFTVSAVMLASSTYAWFTMNKEVNVSNMKVKVISETPYLLVNEASSSGTSDGYDVTASLMATADAEAELKLVNPKTIAPETAITQGGDTMAWQEAVAASADNYAKAGSFTDVTLAADTAQGANPHILGAGTGPSDAFRGYVLSYDLFFKTANSTDAKNLRLATTGGMTVTGVSSGKIEEAVRILFVNQANGAYYLYDCGTGTGTYSDNTHYLGETVSNTDGSVALKVYMYFDGEDTAAFTNNAVNLTAVSAAFKFEVDEYTPGN